MNVAIFAAFPHELKYITRNFSCAKGAKKNPFAIFTGKYGAHEILVIQTGMGVRNAEAAFENVLREFSPDLILSLGFGGAIYRGAKAGDLVWATSVSLLSDEALQTVDIPGARQVAERLEGKIHVRQGEVLTLARWMKKADVKKRFPPDLSHTVCDMETYPLARLSLETGVSFFAVRAITDTDAEEIPEQLLHTTDESGHYSLSRALRTILLHPLLIPEALKLWSASDRASRNLYALVKSLFELSGPW